MQITVDAAVTFEVTNPPKGPHAKAVLEKEIRKMVVNKVVVGPLVVETEYGKHEVSLIETFVHGGYNTTEPMLMPKQKTPYSERL